jgi:hypothetical protein
MTDLLRELERQKKISQAQTWDANEKAMASRLTEKLAAKFAAREKPMPEAQVMLTDEEQEIWQDFVSYCAIEGVRHLPCRTSTLASYLLDRKLTHERMLDTFSVVSKQHDRHSLSLPCGAAVRSVLELEVEFPPPRAWRPETKSIWASLPADIRFEVARIERERDLNFKRLWQKQAEYTKQLEAKAKLNDEKPNETIKPVQNISQPRASAENRSLGVDRR